MYLNIKDNIQKKSLNLTKFLDNDNDGVFYVGHASILVRLNKKKYLFDVIKNTNFYNNSWLFFPSQVNDNRIYDVDGIFVSHIHGDHYDPKLLLEFQKKNIPIYILNGRPGFNKDLKKRKIKVKKIPINKKFYIDKDIWVYGCLHEYNDIDSSLVISNDNLSVYHGNDNFITQKTLIPFKKKVGKIDIGCIPFAFIHYYPYLLNNLKKKDNKLEGARLENQFMNYGIQQSKILNPKVIIPFGSNLFHLDDPKSSMNKAVATPVDFVNYAKKNHKKLKNNYKTMLSNSFCLKRKNKVTCYYKNITSKKFNKSLELFTIKRRNLLNYKKTFKKTKISKIFLKILIKKISKNKNRIDHKILVSNESQKNNKICINIINNKVSVFDGKEIPFNSHYFIVQDNEFNQWLNNKITFEEVLGTRRFRYERNPNAYNVKINSIYTNYL